MAFGCKSYMAAAAALPACHVENHPCQMTVSWVTAALCREESLRDDSALGSRESKKSLVAL